MHIRFRELASTLVLEIYRVLSSGASAAGSHPFSFRTRKLSPPSAMVLTVTGGESS